VLRRALKFVAIFVALFAAFAFLNNSTLFAPPSEGRPTLLAHRGLAQTYRREGLQNDTCTAERIHPPEHPFLENTIASMSEAFRLGADVVEFDIHPTTDGQFAVFHDWTLDCRTNGSGVTRKHALAELRLLDIGHGYTADGGKTYPFRGDGVGLMPSLEEVLQSFPDRRLLIHIKGNDPAEGEMLAARLAQLAPARLDMLMVYGGNQPIEILRTRLPDLRLMSRDNLVQCVLRYFAMGWSGHVPASCRNTLILIPADYARWLWGWPDRFLARMREAGSEVFVVGPLDGDFSNGIDDEATLRSLPERFSGGIWTNRIDRIAPLIRPRQSPAR
jgi:glycerophosphoryl diester phosphodiesterase